MGEIVYHGTMPRPLRTIIQLGGWFVLTGCHDSDALLAKITAYNEMYASTTDSGEPSLPTPTTGTTTGTTGSDTTVQESQSPIADFASEELVDVTISVSHSEIVQARSVVVTATSVGADNLTLIVRQEQQDEVHMDLSPVDDHKLEYPVLIPGDVEFDIVAQCFGGIQ